MVELLLLRSLDLWLFGEFLRIVAWDSSPYKSHHFGRRFLELFPVIISQANFQEGVGIGAVGNPFFGGEAVNICLHSKCEMTDIGDPFCSNIRVCLCLTDQCSLPPAPGSPICVCFNKKLAGGDGWSGQQLFDWSTSFGDYGFVYLVIFYGCESHGRFIRHYFSPPLF